MLFCCIFWLHHTFEELYFWTSNSATYMHTTDPSISNVSTQSGTYMHITDPLMWLHSTHMGTAIAEVQQQQYFECGDNLKIYNKKNIQLSPGTTTYSFSSAEQR